jgi:hypothetical protein
MYTMQQRSFTVLSMTLQTYHAERVSRSPERSEGEASLSV